MTFTINKDIYFYGQKNANGYMSNFYPCDFQDCYGFRFKNSEQYFMYAKCITFEPDNRDMLMKIINEHSPAEVKKLGRQIKNYDERIWGEKRFNYMVHGLWFKFSQNEDIKQLLINTGNCNIYEASPRDKIWGIGMGEEKARTVSKETYGQNLLGKALMEVRKLLVDQQR